MVNNNNTNNPVTSSKQNQSLKTSLKNQKWLILFILLSIIFTGILIVLCIWINQLKSELKMINFDKETKNIISNQSEEKNGKINIKYLSFILTSYVLSIIKK